MIELIKRYPLVCAIIGIAAISMIGSLYYVQDQKRQMQLIQIEREEETAVIEEKEEDKVQQPESTEAEAPEVSAVSSAVPVQPPVKVPVYICGEVQRPGVYYVSSQAIIDEVIRASGGFTEAADQMAVNLASPVMANEKIIIPKQGEQIDKFIESYENIGGQEPNREGQLDNEDIQAQKPAAFQEASSGVSQCVNINTASKEELKSLPGIGDVKAEAILAYREEHGQFANKEELKQVSGIGAKTYDKLAHLITT